MISLPPELATLVTELGWVAAEVDDFENSVQNVNPMFSTFQRKISELRSEVDRLRGEILAFHQHTMRVAFVKEEDFLQETLKNYTSRIHCLRNSIVYLRSYLDLHMECE